MAKMKGFRMTEKGMVRELKGSHVIVAPDTSALCFGCMSQECKHHSGGVLITAENPQSLPLKPGQIVEVEAPGASILKQAMKALLPPALGFAAGYLLARHLFPAAGEGAAAGLGVVFLFAVAFIVYRIRKKFPASKEYKVNRIIK